MRRFAVVGGAGFIGAHLVRRLRDAGEDVVVVDAGEDYARTESARAAAVRAWRRAELLGDVPVLAADTRDAASLRAALTEVAPTHVAHLANLPLADLAAADPRAARASILHGTANVITAAAVLPWRPRLLFASSSMVYGHFAAEPVAEDAPLRPVNAYGRLKLEAERLVAGRCAALGLDWVIVRPSAVYGPGDVNGRIVQRLVEAAVTGAAFTLCCPPQTRLDFTSVHDVATGLHAALLAPVAGCRAYNLTAGRARPVAAALAAVCALCPDLEIRAQPFCDEQPRRGTLDIARARSELGWAPRWQLEAGLVAYVQAVRELEAVAAA